MATAPATCSEFLDLIVRSGLLTAEDLASHGDLPGDPTQCAAVLISKGVLTKYQSKLLLGGKFKGFKLGAYLIREQIGQGGMGTVFLAEHETLKRRVALKVLSLKKDGDNALTIERFLREARSAAALDHQNIVRLHDVGKSGDTHYLVMEYVDGQTLDQLVTRGGTISSSRAVEYIAQAAAGLQHAFERGFIHRDIKPANLILARDGTLKILDMGLARQKDDAGDKLTEVMDKGAIVGTADFISPEQAMNGPLDIRSDIYSLGATFFALVTGSPPFSGNTTQKLLQHQLKAAPSMTSLDKTFPAGLSAVVSKMLEKKAADRYQTPADVIRALAEWIPQQAGARMQAALSNTELARSEEMQSTLSEITSGTMRLGSQGRLNKDVEAARPKKWLVPALVGGVLLLAVAAGILAISGSSNPGTKVTGSVAAVDPPKPVSKPVEPPPPNPPKDIPRTLIYQPDFSKQKPFVERGHNTVAGTGARKWTVDEKEGEGFMPAGWLMTTSKPSAVAETAVRWIDGEPAIGYRGTEGPNNLWLKTPTFTARTGKFIISLEYRTTGESLPVIKYSQETPVRKILSEIKNLPACEGEWRQVTREIEIAAGAAGWVEFHSTGAGRDTIWIRRFNVHQGGNPAEVPSREVPLYSVNFQTIATGKNRYDNVTKSFDEWAIGGKDVLSSFYIHSHKQKITSEYSIADVDGVRALGIQQFEGIAGTQVHFTLNDAQSFLKPDDAITMKIVYRFDGTGSGAACMERRRDRRQKNGRWLLTPTDGKWATLEFPFVRPEHDDPYDLIINCGNGEMEPRAEGVIWIKSVEAYWK